uniref:Cytochrome P450 monooxygenase n=1 Tax=Trametes versicolor TaxID=5325 RepID=A0AA86M7H0_TRAVE|nr:cytochrome P450 monooxygenase [Trametes versicolor]
MSDFVFLAPIAAACLFTSWYIFRQYLARSPLDNLPGPPSASFFLGNVLEITDHHSSQRWKQLVDKYGPVSTIPGMLGARMLHVADPRALHSILIKDMDSYPKSNAPVSDLHLLLGPGLVTTEGAQNRKQRKLLTPVFSVANLRNMTDIFYGVAHRLHKAVEARVEVEVGGVVDVHGWMARVTLEMLGQAGLGYSFDNFIDDSTDAYGCSLKMFFPVLSRIIPVVFLIPKLSYVLPKWLLEKALRAVPHADVRHMMQISDTMAQRSLEIINEKKSALLKGDEALAHQVGEGKDIMSLLLKANTAASDVEKHTDEELVAQMTTIILGGMETTSNALCRIIHLLAENPDVQERLRAEIAEASGGEDLPYDDLVKLPYLEAICRETMRLYAPGQFIPREAAKDTTLPLLNPMRTRDGSVVTEVPVPKGTMLLLHLTGCNTNRDLWGDDVYEWKPERWLGKLPSALDGARIPGVYSNIMTFSGGPRSCIGFKFALLEIKVVLAVLLSTFKFETTSERPIIWKSASAVLYPTTGEKSTRPEMFLKLIRIAQASH